MCALHVHVRTCTVPCTAIQSWVCYTCNTATYINASRFINDEHHLIITVITKETNKKKLHIHSTVPNIAKININTGYYTHVYMYFWEWQHTEAITTTTTKNEYDQDTCILPCLPNWPLIRLITYTVHLCTCTSLHQ